MDLEDYYRILGLRSGVSFADVKASYRRLVQQYHPDINPDDLKAKDKFIAVTEAYKFLQTVLLPEEINPRTSATEVQTQPAAPKTMVTPRPQNLQEIEQRLKWKTYEQLQRFLQEKRFPQAIALAEALVARLPGDGEVRQWLAIAYQIWGRALITQKQLPKARIYLKKALKTDPYNKTLWSEIQQDFQRLELKL
ncbi:MULTISPECIES: DnaJ domain-containing protein [unclassified Anabaena]|jgi:tetratricopeptide (TPR) repeat protein|uniref:J domain-containing protein n=1 Tax=unclassified Anabaena TaxID=2619674 RepID=UPI0006AC79C3|nr:MULTISPECIES: DnaJ domain-containing protein [unclassified Anabaena]ALB40821.1 molecular chaperone DnaJ [Anabaena sp. WA102]MCX5981040.1 DnaJ domain-containing protein [Nostocales cyanobacterium LacPavin_0920_SED1_MAG_38_18]OBQ20850.1 MAG: molecular chaperone DnaJ [Anabaena sp. AL93]